jgi:hypothetical protein
MNLVLDGARAAEKRVENVPLLVSGNAGPPIDNANFDRCRIAGCLRREYANPVVSMR